MTGANEEGNPANDTGGAAGSGDHPPCEALSLPQDPEAEHAAERAAQERLLAARRRNQASLGGKPPDHGFRGTAGLARPVFDLAGVERARLRLMEQGLLMSDNQADGAAICGRIGQATKDMEVRAGLRGVPIAGETWDAMLAWDPSEDEECVLKAIRDRAVIVGLAGAYGCGKTALLAHVVMIFQGRSGREIPAYFIHAKELAEVLMHPYTDTRRKQLELCNEAECLAIDDLATEPDLPDVVSAFEGLLILRYNRGLLTLFTSNEKVRSRQSGGQARISTPTTEKPGDSKPAIRGLRDRYLSDERMMDRFRSRGFFRSLNGPSRRVPALRKHGGSR
jgi:hypothetical protein